MDEKLRKARETIIEQISKNMTLYGVIPTVGRLMGTMYYHEEPMTLNDMVNELGMSKASMSTAVRELMDLGLVEKVWKAGERKDLYKVEEDNYQTFITLFSTNWRKGLNTNVTAIHKSIRELNNLLKEEMNEDTKKLIEKDIDKLHDALEYSDWLSRLIDLFESNEIFKYVPLKKDIVAK